MTNKRSRVLGQDKDIEGKLTKPTVKSTIGKFKEQYADRCENPNQPIVGFELNGGDGMTKGASEAWEEFKGWCEQRNLDAEYNSNNDLSIMKNTLRNRVDNKLINKNTQ